MRNLILLLFLCIFCFASSGWAQDQEVRSLLDRNVKFTPDGKVSEDDLYGFPTYHEDGIFNGVAYRIYYLDGSGTFEGVMGNGLERVWNKNKSAVEGLKDIADMKKNWMVGCREDAVDILTCIMVIPGMSILVNTKGQKIVAIHGDDGDPRGQTVGIRFDNGAKYEGGNDSWLVGATADQIIDGLKTAKKVTTSFRRHGYSMNRTRTLYLYGFNETFTYVNWVVNKCKKTYDARKGLQPDIGGHGFQPCT